MRNPVDREQSLKELADIVSPHAPLYAVGGYVRDRLLGLDGGDVDIASHLTVDRMKSILAGSRFVVSDRNLRMGTVHIYSHSEYFEYTTFRSDSYDKSSGKHYPDDVIFTDSILLDAKRRDFKCNAVYYDIKRGEIVDPLGGAEDIKNRVISTADEPSITFEADGLRVLRLVRFCAELGFEIEEETLKAAKENAWRVKDIAKERVRDELMKIFVADARHPELGLKDAHLKGFRLLDELGLVDMLLPELAALKGMPQPKKYHLYDAYEHSVKAFELAPPRLRWAALLHDIGKVETMRLYGNMHSHAEYSATLARALLARLRFSTKQKSDIVDIIAGHMTDVNGDMSRYKLKRFAIEHIDRIEDICELMDIDALAASGKQRETNRLLEAYLEMKADNVPLHISELKVDGLDLVEAGVPENMRTTLLKELLVDTAMNKTLDNREAALCYIAKKAKKLRN